MTREYSENLFAELGEAAFAIGPGLGTTPDKVTLIEKALASSLSLVLDADALTILSGLGKEGKLKRDEKVRFFLLPHPKEASRTFGRRETSEISDDRFLSLPESSPSAFLLPWS